MKILFINSVCGTGSTGKICVTLAKELEQQGHKVKIACGARHNVSEDGKKYAVIIGNKKDMYFHLIKSRFGDRHGFASKKATLKFINWAEEYNPDLLCLHNLHGYYLNIAVLFNWIKSRPQMQVKWTLHDCWAFTGHCTHFVLKGCQKWKTRCKRCPLRNKYPKSLFGDASSRNHKEKEALFSNIRNMTIITPSYWMKDLANQSFLKQYPIEVVRNVIDIDIFKPTESNFREKYNLADKTIVLGVSNVWGNKKGYNYMLELASLLGNKYAVVIVGDVLKESQKLPTPPNCVFIKRTENQHQLAEIYSAADVFFNPTILDNYPTVNLEAEACGTPVVTFDTGGAKETIHLPKSKVIAQGAIHTAFEVIQELTENEE